MKYTIDIPDNQVTALDSLASFDSGKGKVCTHKMAIETAVTVFLRIRQLSTEDQNLIANIIEGK